MFLVAGATGVIPLPLLFSKLAGKRYLLITYHTRTPTVVGVFELLATNSRKMPVTLEI